MERDDPARAFVTGSDGIVTRFYTHLLSEAGCDVTIAMSMNDAQHIHSGAAEYDALLIDPDFANGRGRDLLVSAATRYTDVPIVALAAQIPAPRIAERSLRAFSALSRRTDALKSQAHALVGHRLDDVEEALTNATISACGGSVTRAAEILGVSPSTIYRRRERGTTP